MKKELKFLLVFIISVAVSACGGNDNDASPQQVRGEVHAEVVTPPEYASKTNPYNLSAEVINAGEQLFRLNCISCHGENGQGEGVASASLEPSPPNLSVVAASANDGYLFWRIAEGGGIFQSAMPAWKKLLSEDEIWQGVSYIQSLASK